MEVGKTYCLVCLGFLKAANSRCCGGRDIRSEADETSIAIYGDGSDSNSDNAKKIEKKKN
jgi:hypothetical protein